MAVRAEQLLRVHLDQLSLDEFPEDHPQRRFLREEVARIAAFNASIRDGTALETPTIPTPESITAQLRDRWTQRGGRIGKTYDVPDLSATPDQLAEIYRGGRRISLVPRGITLEDLGRIFPNMKSWTTSEGTNVISDPSEGGYFAVEASLDSPNLGFDEKHLRMLFDSQGREGMTLPTYIVASQDAKLETGQYFDEGVTWSRLPGSRLEGGVVHADFSPDGNLLVDSVLDPQDVLPNLGGRSQEAISA